MANTTFYNRGDAYHDSAGNPAIIKRGNELTFTEHFNAGGGSELTPATAETLGGVKVGNGLNVTSDGMLSVAGVDYSTNEQLTGRKDIDGKNIYSKSFTVESLPNNTDLGFNHGITNIHRLVKLYGAAQNADKTSFFPLPYVAQENFAGCIKLSMNTTQISIWAGSDRRNLSAIVTVEYTKPTPAEPTNTRTSKKKG